MLRWVTKDDPEIIVFRIRSEKELMCGAQEQSVRGNYIKINIDKSIDATLSRLCHFWQTPEVSWSPL